MHRSILFPALIAALALPAAAQDKPAPEPEKPAFHTAPLGGAGFDRFLCIQPDPDTGENVTRGTPRRPIPGFVPPDRRTAGRAAIEIERPVLRSYTRAQLGAEGATVPEVAASLAEARDRLREAMQAAGLEVLAIETVDASIAPARRGGDAVQGTLAVTVLLSGAVEMAALQALQTTTGARFGQMHYDHASDDLVAEDLRPELERTARAAAATQAAEQGAELGRLLESKLISRPADRATLRVDVALTYAMRPVTAARGN